MEGNVDEILSKIDQAILFLQTGVGKIYAEAASDALDSIDQRISESGIAADGSQLGVYADSTKKIKEKKGRESNFVNLTDTGSMWANIGITQKSTGSNYFVNIAAKDSSEDDKLKFNEERYGDILELSPIELIELTNFVDKRIIAEFNRIFR